MSIFIIFPFYDRDLKRDFEAPSTTKKDLQDKNKTARVRFFFSSQSSQE